VTKLCLGVWPQMFEREVSVPPHHRCGLPSAERLER